MNEYDIGLLVTLSKILYACSGVEVGFDKYKRLHPEGNVESNHTSLMSN